MAELNGIPSVDTSQADARYNAEVARTIEQLQARVDALELNKTNGL